jgi:hypothetical protein
LRKQIWRDTTLSLPDIALAVGGFVWSKSSSEIPDALTEARAATASVISPMELMLQHRGTLPTESWDSF